MNFAAAIIKRYILLFILSAIDCYLTNKVVGNGHAAETNPIVNYAIQHHGLESILYIKIFTLITLAIMLTVCFFKQYKWVIYAMNGLIIGQSMAVAMGLWIFIHAYY